RSRNLEDSDRESKERLASRLLQMRVERQEPSPPGDLPGLQKADPGEEAPQQTHIRTAWELVMEPTRGFFYFRSVFSAPFRGMPLAVSIPAKRPVEGVCGPLPRRTKPTFPNPGSKTL